MRRTSMEPAETRRGMVRVFVAIPLGPAPAQELGEIIRQARSQWPVEYRWVAEQNLHVTLRFIGDIAPPDVDAVISACRAAAAACPPLNLRCAGTGAFPGWHRPSVIWVGLDGDTAALAQLAGRLEQQLVAAGFPPADKPFRAHITLARAKAVCLDANEYIKAAGARLSGAWQATTLVVYQSRLSAAGPTYTPLGSVPLG